MNRFVNKHDEEEAKRMFYTRTYYATWADNPRMDRMMPVFEWVVDQIRNNGEIRVADVFIELQKKKYDTVVKPTFRSKSYGVPAIVKLFATARKVNIGGNDYELAITKKSPVDGSEADTQAGSWIIFATPGLSAQLAASSITPPTPPVPDPQAEAEIDTTTPVTEPEVEAPPATPEPSVEEYVRAAEAIKAPALAFAATPKTPEEETAAAAVPAGERPTPVSATTPEMRQYAEAAKEERRLTDEERWQQMVPIEDKDYKPRKKGFGKWNDIALLKLAFANNLNVLMEGPPGGGKTQACEELARQLGVAFGRIELHGGVSMDDLIGHFIPEKSETLKIGWANGILPIILQGGGVFLADEINALPPELSTKFYGLLDKGRRIILTEYDNSEIKAEKGRFIFIAAYNPGVLGELTPALRDRFDIILEYEYDEDVEDVIIKNKDVLRIRDMLRPNIGDPATGKQIETPLSTRGLQQLENLFKLLKEEDTAIEIFTHKFQKGTERDAVKDALKQWKVTST